MGEFAIGRDVPRFEDARLVTGRGAYIDDIALPRMAFGYVLRSRHAHARIKSLDVAGARSAPGVLCVFTGADWQASGLGDLPSADGGLKRPDGRPMYRPPSPALVHDRARWVGDYIAFIVAETLELAKDAAELIDVGYEPLPGVFSTAAALDNGPPSSGTSATTTCASSNPWATETPRRRRSRARIMSFAAAW